MLARLILRRRLRRGKEHPLRWGERLGHPGHDRPPGRLVWLHGASVGESLSVLPLIGALRQRHPDLRILVTTGTVTSAALMADRLPPDAIHQFVPVDSPAAVRRFLDHWRPDLALWVESELWPNLLRLTARRGVPMVLINARMSARSFRRWARLRWLARWLIGKFTLVLAQSAADAARYRALGARRVEEPGNLKFAADPLPADAAVLDQMRAEIGQPCWLVASTHPGEEALAGQVDAALRRRWPHVTTLIAPRHPQRGPEIAARLGADHPGRAVACRAQGARPQPGAVYIADTLGEMGLWYRLAPLVVMGGSFVGKGGQNPLEAARLGAAVVMGPDMANFAQIADRLITAGAALSVEAAGLAAAVETLLADPASIAAMGRAGMIAAEDAGAVVARICAALDPLLPAPVDGAVS